MDTDAMTAYYWENLKDIPQQQLADNNEYHTLIQKKIAAEIETQTALKEEKSGQQKSFFGKREDLSGRIGRLDKDLFRLQILHVEDVVKDSIEEEEKRKVFLLGLWERR